MTAFQRKASRLGISITLAASMLLSSLPVAFAQAVNTVNDGRNVQGGTYWNTPGGQTVFQNSHGTGLYIGKGVTVTGRELGTTNGGNLLFNAPGQVVRFDGNVNVSAAQNGAGLYLGNGGTVTVNASYFAQNGNIFANGINGGHVILNVGAMTMGPNARIEARGSANPTTGIVGNGGVVQINSPGAVNINRGAIIDTSGKIIGTYDTNVISIKGGLVNLDGILIANGGDGGQNGGIITVNATGNTTAVNGNAGGSDLLPDAKALIALDLKQRKTMDGSVNVSNTGAMTANGSDGISSATNAGITPTNGGEGGKVEIIAVNRIDNAGLLSANGGNGGSNHAVMSDAVRTQVDGSGKTVLVQDSQGKDGGLGGNGGAVIIRNTQNNHFSNTGTISVKGGNGGDGQAASSVDPGADKHYAHGGNGANAGNGGWVEIFGQPAAGALGKIVLDGGKGGQGGSADPSNCGCSGGGGACGAPGQLVIHPFDTPPITPPVTPPTTPPRTPAPFVRENTRAGDGLRPNQGPVLTYNRSIFLARAPLPIIQKRTPAPQPVEAPKITPPPAPPKPKPVPPKKKVMVRGYW